MASPGVTRELVPVFVEKKGDQDIKTLLFVRVGNEFKSLAELDSSSKPEPAEVPELTSTIVETTSADGPITRSVSTSPFRLCCVIVNGVKICYPC